MTASMPFPPQQRGFDRRGFDQAPFALSHHHHGPGIWGLLTLVLFVLLALGFLWLLWQSRQRVAPVRVADDAALTELRLRYARGELTREQFSEADADLRGVLPPAPPAAPA